MAACVIIEGVRPVETGAGPVLSHDGPGSAWEAASGRSQNGTPAFTAAVMNARQGVQAGALGDCCEGSAAGLRRLGGVPVTLVVDGNAPALRRI